MSEHKGTIKDTNKDTGKDTGKKTGSTKPSHNNDLRSSNLRANLLRRKAQKKERAD